MAKFRFTDGALRSLKPEVGRPRIDYDTGDVRGFAIQTTPKGTKTFLLVYVAKATGFERRMVLGEFGPPPKLSLTAGRKKAISARAKVNSGSDPWLEDTVGREERQAAKVRSAATLQALLMAYVKHLENAGKPSASEVAASIKRNLFDPFPKLARLPADEVTSDSVMPVFHRLTKAGKWRAAEKLAVYLRAAYNAAKASRTDAAGHVFAGFLIRTNPLQELKASRPKETADAAAGHAVERKWALTVAQLQAYWERLRAIQTPQGALLRFHLLTGGQRMEQLSRLVARDLDAKAGTITLWDTKGRRQKAREHRLPLLTEARAALDDLSPKATGPHLFSVSGGAAPAVPHTLAAAMREISTEMVKSGEIDRPLTPGAIRRTVETVLADNDVSKDIRAKLLSHGVSGVQDRHYDAGDYLKQKRIALEKLRSLLEA